MTIDCMIYRQRVIVCRFSRESGEEWRRGQILCLVKQTNSIIQSSDPCMCQWFYNSRSNDQKRLQ